MAKNDLQRAELKAECESLLKISASEQIPLLESDTSLLYVGQKAFDYFSREMGEKYEVHVTVTRDHDGFIDHFVTEEYRKANFKK